MIEFSGQISYETEKHLYKKARKILYAASSFAWLVLLIPIVFFAIRIDYLSVIYVYIAMLPFMNLVMLLYRPNKKKPAGISKIIADEECISYTADRASLHRYICDAKEVRDYGDFYDVIYPFGNGTTVFVCQKNLLTKGTLLDFEKLFEGKIVRMNQLSA